MIKVISIRIEPAKASSEIELLRTVARTIDVDISEINDFRIVRRSVDARQRKVMLNLTVRIAFGDDKRVSSIEKPVEFIPVKQNAPEVIIIGAGPAGLFAALHALSRGLKPIVIERGRDVDSRRRDIAEISRGGKINPQSNFCFGEGGAGAYSDGKLFTRSKKRGSVEEVLQLLVQHGASPDILIDAHPHIGSDKLPHVIKAIRNTIINNGGEVRFETCVTGLLIKDGKIEGVRTDKGQVNANAVILALGHSAHDTYRRLFKQGIGMEPKGIAVGVRLEHPQSLIDKIQYHNKEGRGKYLPAAEYSFVTQIEGRGVYSFCMCPGGVIVPSGSSEGELVVNGMSASARSGKYANSGMVVEIRPGDFDQYSDSGSLEMLELQETLEKKMYEASNNSIVAPAQRMKDFINSEVSSSLPQTTYAPGIQSADFNRLLPSFISSRLKRGFEEFGKKARGFLTNDAVMIGLESRTSAPIRIVRDKESLQSITTDGLFPAGEGAGYAGGIVSAAIDGMRCAEAASNYLKNINCK